MRRPALWLAALAALLPAAAVQAQIMLPNMPSGKTYYFAFDDFNYTTPTNYSLATFNNSSVTTNQRTGATPQSLFGVSTWFVPTAGVRGGGIGLTTVDRRFWYSGSIQERPSFAAEEVNNTPSWSWPNDDLEISLGVTPGAGTGNSHGVLDLGLGPGHYVQSSTSAHDHVSIQSALLANTGTWIFRVRAPYDYHAWAASNTSFPQFLPWLFAQVNARNLNPQYQWEAGGNIQIPYSWSEFNTETFYNTNRPLSDRWEIKNGISTAPGFVEHSAAGNTNWQNFIYGLANPEIIGGNGQNPAPGGHARNSVYASLCPAPTTGPAPTTCSTFGYDADPQKIAEYFLSGDRYIWIRFSIAADGKASVAWMANNHDNEPISRNNLDHYVMAQMESYDARLVAELAKMTTILWVGHSNAGQALARGFIPRYDMFFYSSDPTLDIWNGSADAMHIRNYMITNQSGQYMRMTNKPADYLDNGLAWVPGAQPNPQDGHFLATATPTYTLGYRFSGPGTVKTYAGTAPNPTAIQIHQRSSWAYVYPVWGNKQAQVLVEPAFTLYGFNPSNSTWVSLATETDSGFNYAFNMGAYTGYSKFKVQSNFEYVDQNWTSYTPQRFESRDVIFNNPYYTGGIFERYTTTPMIAEDREYDVYDMLGRRVVTEGRGDVDQRLQASGQYILRYRDTGETVTLRIVR